MNPKVHCRVYKNPPELLYKVSVHKGLYVNILKVKKLCNFSSRVDTSNKSMTNNCNRGFLVTLTYVEVFSMLILTVLSSLCSCDRASWVKREERKPTRCNNIRGRWFIVNCGCWLLTLSQHVSGIKMPETCWDSVNNQHPQLTINHLPRILLHLVGFLSSQFFLRFHSFSLTHIAVSRKLYVSEQVTKRDAYVSVTVGL